MSNRVEPGKTPLGLPWPEDHKNVVKIELTFARTPDGRMAYHIQNSTVMDINGTALIILFLTHMFRNARSPQELDALVRAVAEDLDVWGLPWDSATFGNRSIEMHPKEGMN